MRPARIASRSAIVAAAFLWALMSPTAPVLAQEAPQPPGGGFSMPVACRLGTDCWVMNYPDMAVGPGKRDPHCKHRTYDGHKGTDIALRDLAAMRRGVDVLAAADGTVLRVRDRIADKIVQTPPDRAAIKGRECGNGVVIDHGEGWEAQYCHLRRGSIVVKPGERIARGQKTGRVGASGLTAFPHLHIGFRHKGRLIDPLTARSVASGCGPTKRTLWSRAGLDRYRHTQLYAVGLTDGPVTANRLKQDSGTVSVLSPRAPALVLWATAFGVATGDRLRLEITGPDGKIMRRTVQKITRPQAWRMAYFGLRRRGASWPPGRYRGSVTLLRSIAEGTPEQNRTITIDIGR